MNAPCPLSLRAAPPSPARAAIARKMVATTFTVRAQTIPLRLTEEERSMLRVLEGALSVSEYTDKVDVLARGGGSRSSRIEAQLVDTCAVLSGLMLAVRPQSRKLIQGRELADNAALFERIFEVGRRHKIMNPDSMRDGYGEC